MKLKKLLLIAWIMIVFSSQIFGFYAFNRRNHPELDWKEVQSENVTIVYHDPLSETAQEALQVAEASYQSLSQSYDLELDEKVKIFISNQDDITNGFSMAGHHIVIWVDVNDYVNMFTGRESWLRKVIAHEMSHHFVFHSIRSWIDMFMPVTALSFPSDFNEGYAMFLSGEKWGFGRSDASLRKAVYSNKMSYKYRDGFHYTTGFSMVRYLYEFHGIEKLQELLKYRNELKIYDFKKAFKKVYGKSFKDFKEEWRRYIYTYYYGTGYELKQLANSDTSLDMTFRSLQSVPVEGWNNVENLVMNDSMAVILGKKSEKQYYKNIVLGRYNPDTLATDTLEFEEIISIKELPNAFYLDISSNSRYVRYFRNIRFENGIIRIAKSIFYSKKKKNKKIVQGEMPQVANNGDVFYQILIKGKNYIKKYKNRTVETLLTFPESKIGILRLSPDDRFLAITRMNKNKKFLFEIYDLNELKLVSKNELKRLPREILWTDNDNLILTIPSDKDSRTIIKKYSRLNKKWTEYLSPPFNVIPVLEEKTDSTHKLLLQAELDRKDKQIGKIKLKTDSTDIFDNYHQDNYYNRWIRAQNPNPITLADTIPQIVARKNYKPVLDMRPLISLPLPDEEGFTLMNFWMDPLMKHSLNLVGYFPYNSGDPYYFINYLNNCLKPTLSLSYARYNWIGGIWEDKIFYQKVQDASFLASFPVNVNIPLLNMNIAPGLNYRKVQQKEKNFDKEPIFENGEAFAVRGQFGIGYNLPFKNSNFHPIRKLKLSYKGRAASTSLGMNQDFTDHEITIDAGIAPFYDIFGLNLDNFLVTNQTTLEWLNGNYLEQYQPGIDSYENIPISGGVISRRRYIRGVEKTLIGDQLLVTKSELWAKVSDDFKMSFIFGFPILDLKYTGVGGWFDYGKLWLNGQNNSPRTFKTMGYEIKGVLNILTIPTIQRFGKAFDMDGNSRGYYYQVEIPFYQNLY